MAQFKVLRNVLMTLLVFVSMFVDVDMDGLSMVLTDVELANVPLNVKLEADVDDADVELESEKTRRFETSINQGMCEGHSKMTSHKIHPKLIPVNQISDKQNVWSYSHSLIYLSQIAF